MTAFSMFGSTTSFLFVSARKDFCALSTIFGQFFSSLKTSRMLFVVWGAALRVGL
jgi:hypothetical protein